MAEQNDSASEKALIDSITELKNTVSELSKVQQSQLKILEDLHKSSLAIERDTYQSRLRLEQIRHSSAMELRNDIWNLMQSRQLGFMETITRIRSEKLSFSRYGDGEFRIMVRPCYNLPFQQNHPQLREDLHRILQTPAPGNLIGMPQVFVDLHWTTIFAELWPNLRPYFVNSHGRTYGNSHVTRPPFFSTYREEATKAWSDIWKGKKVAIVAGKGSRFELVPELFDSAASIERIDSLPTNAYTDLERVISEIERVKPDVTLIALGPTGTVLADRVTYLGIQALDIGHISASYRNIFDGQAVPERMPVKQGK